MHETRTVRSPGDSNARRTQSVAVTNTLNGTERVRRDSHNRDRREHRFFAIIRTGTAHPRWTFRRQLSGVRRCPYLGSMWPSQRNAASQPSRGRASKRRDLPRGPQFPPDSPPMRVTRSVRSADHREATTGTASTDLDWATSASMPWRCTTVVHAVCLVVASKAPSSLRPRNAREAARGHTPAVRMPPPARPHAVAGLGGPPEPPAELDFRHYVGRAEGKGLTTRKRADLRKRHTPIRRPHRRTRGITPDLSATARRALSAPDPLPGLCLRRCVDTSGFSQVAALKRVLAGPVISSRRRATE